MSDDVGDSVNGAWRRRGRSLLLSLAVLTLGLATTELGPLGTAGAESAPGGPEVLDRPLRGTAALAALGDDLPQVAAQNDTTATALTRVLRQDRTAWVDRHGGLFYVDDDIPPAGASTPSEPGPFPYADTFRLHLRPESERVIYLDFNGHTVSGTGWNDSGVSTNAQPAFDTDGNPGAFSNAEQDLIQGVFQRVAEDFNRFNVDVTTEEPPASDITRSSFFDTRYGTRVLITPSVQAHNAICSTACGGKAYVGVFNDEPAATHSFSQPAWVFPHQLGNDQKNIAEAISHEVGHNIGLNHDGTTAGAEYYSGHGAWAPIMGSGYDNPITQWSRGEYTGANNTEDDLAVASSHGVVVAADDHADIIGDGGTRFPTNIGTAGPGGVLGTFGIIHTAADRDTFLFTQNCSGTTEISINSNGNNSPNLDARLRVYNANDVQLADIDPVSARTNRSVASGLAATTTLALARGTYQLSVDGVGALNPASTGYSDYGSLGAFAVQVRTCTAPTAISGMVRDGDGNPLRGARITIVGSTIVPATSSSTGTYSFPEVPPGTHTLRAERMCRGAQTQSVTVDGPETVNFTMPASSSCEVRAQTWIDGSTVLPLTGDDAATTVNLPFPYRHYGTDYTSAHVSTNGHVNFLAESAAHSNTAIPNAAVPNAALYPFWDDLIVDAESSVRTRTVGTSPNRRFVIEWLNVTLFADGTRRLDFEVILSENRNERVVFQYRNIDAGTPFTGTSATIGKENAAGDAAAQLNFNQGLVFNGLSVAPK